MKNALCNVILASLLGVAPVVAHANLCKAFLGLFPQPELVGCLNKSCSVDELSADIRNNWQAYRKRFPAPKVASLKEAVATYKNGTFELKKTPQAQDYLDVVNGYPGEIGLIKIKGVWFVSINEGLETNWGEPTAILPLERFDHVIHFAYSTDLVEVDLHSHPGNDPIAYTPSFADITSSKIRQRPISYIATDRGILRYQIPLSRMGLIPSVDRSWETWIHEDLQLDEDSYDRIGGAALRRQFFENFYGLRFLPPDEANALFR